MIPNSRVVEEAAPLTDLLPARPVSVIPMSPTKYDIHPTVRPILNLRSI